MSACETIIVAGLAAIVRASTSPDARATHTIEADARTSQPRARDHRSRLVDL